jgi:hypothetical protein
MHPYILRRPAIKAGKSFFARIRIGVPAAKPIGSVGARVVQQIKAHCLTVKLRRPIIYLDI